MNKGFVQKCGHSQGNPLTKKRRNRLSLSTNLSIPGSPPPSFLSLYSSQPISLSCNRIIYCVFLLAHLFSSPFSYWRLFFTTVSPPFPVADSLLFNYCPLLTSAPLLYPLHWPSDLFLFQLALGWPVYIKKWTFLFLNPCMGKYIQKIRICISTANS